MKNDVEHSSDHIIIYILVAGSALAVVNITAGYFMVAHVRIEKEETIQVGYSSLGCALGLAGERGCYPDELN